MQDHIHAEQVAHHHAFESPMTAAYAELESEVLYGLATQATNVLGELCDRYGVEVGRILDIGCGPGVGTCTLAQRFESAKILALDGSAAMLERLTARARRIGVAPRVETRHVELPAGLIAIGRADVVWASLVLHHLGERPKRSATSGGCSKGVCLPSSSPPARCGPYPQTSISGGPGSGIDSTPHGRRGSATRFTELPEHPSSDHGSAMLQDYGFELVADQMLTLSVDPPLGAQARRFAHNYLLGLQAQLATHADVADLDALDVLTQENAEQSIIRRHDAQIHASRRLYVARAVSDCM